MTQSIDAASKVDLEIVSGGEDGWKVKEWSGRVKKGSDIIMNG